MTVTPGSRLGPYSIIGLLGAGGMGEVYRARDTRLGREVAIKVLPPAFGEDKDRMQRFALEARTVGSLNHPNIVALYDVGQEDGQSYVVSELLEGQTLHDRLAGEPLPVRKAMEYAAQMAHGLAAAHDKGVVHRDLKPENVFVTKEGRVKILDFGLARQVRSIPENAATDTFSAVVPGTEPGTVLGTVGYMSPEQVRGQVVDSRADVFSFGAILHEMLSGRRAFQRATAVETMHAILKEDAPELAPPAGRVPAALERIVRRCLEKNPNERFRTAHDLAFALETLSGSRIEPGPTPGVSRPVSRGRWIGRLVGAVALAALGTLSLSSLLRPGRPDLASYRFTPFATDAGYEGQAAWSPDGRALAYIGEAGGILQVFTRSLDSFMAAQITRSRRDCKDPFWSADGSRIFYVSLAGSAEGLWSVGAAGGEAQLILKKVSAAALSPDGNTLFLLREDNYQGNFLQSLWVSSPLGAEPQRYTQPPLADKRFARGFLRFAPDGRSVGLWGAATTDDAAREAGYANPELWVIPTGGDRPRRVLHDLPHVPDASPFSWEPDSRHVVFAAEFRTQTPGTHLWMADTMKATYWPLTATSGSEQYPAVSPSGREIAFTVQEEDYDLVEIPLDGSALRSVLATSRTEADPVWSPLGNQFAYITDRSGSQEIWLRSRDGAIERPLVTRASFPDTETFLLSGLAFAPDGKRVAYQRRGRGGFRVWISAVAGGPAVQLATDDSYQDGPTWSPDGNWVAYAFRRRGQWGLAKVRVGGGETPLVIKEGVVYPSNPKWSPTGAWITCDTPDGFGLVSPDGKESLILSEEAALAHAWSRDGRSVYAVRSDEGRFQLVVIDVATRRETTLVKDLGPSPISDDPLKGLSLAPDGRSFLTSILRLRGDLWLLSGFEPRRASPWSLWGSSGP